MRRCRTVGAAGGLEARPLAPDPRRWILRRRAARRGWRCVRLRPCGCRHRRAHLRAGRRRRLRLARTEPRTPADLELRGHPATRMREAFERRGRAQLRARRRTSLLRHRSRCSTPSHTAPGPVEAVLIDPQHVIVQGCERCSTAGIARRRSAHRRRAEARPSFAGRESDPRTDRRDFEFVVPVNLPGGRYAYDVTYDHRTYDAQLGEVRTILLPDRAARAARRRRRLLPGRRPAADARPSHGSAAGHARRADRPAQPARLPGRVPATRSLRPSRYEDPLALVLLDVDDFKLINDRHGHPQGDSVLRVVAGVLRSSRPGDRPYRIGGDEFALLLAHTDAEGARTLARRLCATSRSRRSRSASASARCARASRPTRCAPRPTPRCMRPSARAATAPRTSRTYGSAWS